MRKGSEKESMKQNIKDAKFKMLLLCGDCGKQLNETKEMTGKELYDGWTMLIMTSGFNAGTCPEGCRSTFSDLNINTSTPVVDIKTGKHFELQAYKFTNGHFYNDDYNEVCHCESVTDDEIYFSDKYPEVHGVCGKWIQPYKDSED